MFTTLQWVPGHVHRGFGCRHLFLHSFLPDGDRVRIGRSRRRGLSLLELICVIAIIGLLMALFLPAIQSARESARSTACLNNLRQIGLATQAYETARGHFPPGNLGFSEAYTMSQESRGSENWYNPDSPGFWKRAQHSSWLTLLLPQLEMGALYETLPSAAIDPAKLYSDYTNSSGQWVGDLAEVKTVMTTRMPLLLCPSDNVADGDSVGFVSAQIATESTDGADALVAEPALWETQQPSPTNYIGCAGAHSGGMHLSGDISGFRGVLTTQRRTRRAMILDGSSNTVLAGENIGSIHQDRRMLHFSWMFGALGRGRGGLPWESDMLEAQPQYLLLGDRQYSYPAGFGSMHPGHVGLVYTDGSTHKLSRLTHWKTLYALCGIADRSVEVNLH